LTAPLNIGHERSEVLYGAENAINLILQLVSRAKSRIDLCDDYTIPSVSIPVELLENAVSEAKRKYMRFRYITEITHKNILHCKELMKIAEVRHLNGIKANFVVSDTEYTSTAVMQEVHAIPEVIYSNVKRILDQQQYLFETLWNKAIPAEQKIREIEQGIEPEFVEVITDGNKAAQFIVEFAKSVKNEAQLILPHDKTMVIVDKLGIWDYLILASMEGAGIRIICPLSEENLQIGKRISSRAPNIKILDGQNSDAILFIVDNKKYFRAEDKDPYAAEASDAISVMMYSNSKKGVNSFRTFFDLLWKETELYEQLKVHDKMQKEFINIASHEMKTPTQAILVLSRLLQSHPEKREEMIQAICRNAIRLQKLTNDILDVTRIETHTLNLNKEQFNLNDIILNVIEDHGNQIREANLDNIKLSYEPEEDIILVEADKARLTQVISNLVSNAIKFTKEGTISITTEKKDKQITVSVKDSGAGIDSEIFPRLFSKFATKSDMGTGLGLFISKSIIEAHGGKMWAENNTHSRGEKGATFYFTIPIISSDKAIEQQ
jgi:two-component system, OmpR family, sensor histidine kinase VicK